MAWTFVASGALASNNNAASLAPALPAGIAFNDLLVLEWQNFGGASARVPVLPTGWTAFTGDAVWQSGTSSHLFAYAQNRPGVAAPTITTTGVGVAGDTQLARIHAFRPGLGNFALDVVGAESTNASADNVGPITTFTPTTGALGLLTCGKTNDWNGTATLTDWTLATAVSESTTGNDAGMALLYRLSMPAGATGALTVTDGGGTASNGVGYGQMASFVEVQPKIEEDGEWIGVFVAGARQAMAGALMLGATMATQARALTLLDGETEEAPSAAATPITGSAGAGMRVQPINAGFKQLRAAIAVADDLPVAAAPTVALDEDGFTARVSWPSLATPRVILDEDDLPVAAPPTDAFEHDDAVVLRAPWPPTAPVRAILDDDELPPQGAVAFVPDEDYSIPRVGTPADFLVAHPTGFGAADESITSTLEEHDHYLPAASWPVRAPRQVIGTEDDLPVAAGPTDPMTGSAGAGLRVQPINAGFKPPRAAVTDTDPLPIAAAAIALDDDGFTARVSWPSSSPVRAFTDDDDLPPQAAPSVALEHDDAPVLRTAWPATHPVRSVTDSDELPTAAAPTLAHEAETGPITPRPWPRLTARAVTDDGDLPIAAAPTPALADDDAPLLRAPWPASRTPAVITDTEDRAPLAALAEDDGRLVVAPRRPSSLARAIDADEEWAPRPIAFEEDCTVLRLPWPWWRPAQAFRDMGVDRVPSGTVVRPRAIDHGIPWATSVDVSAPLSRATDDSGSSTTAIDHSAPQPRSTDASAPQGTALLPPDQDFT